ncbi:MAG: hypothetical protein FRX49_03531 [Trebouxia sp. A1-2]|nr:MAG: hypothetical protein FRX49_13821 [Trebouxia sp. A1-2]KAA6426420.1 MAG: hypothetical protein FRX49_03531 [Trebouxia sp. A1-2]
MKFTVISVLLLSILVVGVASRQLLDADLDSALEHQRILAELEEVHQLRERMLQQAATYVSSSGAPAPAPAASPAQPAGTTGANSGGAESSSRLVILLQQCADHAELTTWLSSRLLEY